MAKRPLPSAEELRQLLRYEAETGKLFWLERPRSMFETQRHCSVWNAKYSGKEAFTTTDNHGYRGGCIFKNTVKAHRVAMALVMGAWPTDEVDHINGVRSDNRLSNIRLATRSENMRNKKIASHNASGFKGVFWCTQRRKWRANIRADGKNIYLGHFTTPEEAHRAYIDAAEKMHGEFARAQ